MPSGQSQVLGHMLLNTLEHLPFKYFSFRLIPLVFRHAASLKQS